MNDAFNRMQDNDKDGLWETTANLEVGTYEYKFKLNQLFWTNDPDNPLIGESADANSVTYSIADSIPVIKLVQPSETTIYENDPGLIKQPGAYI